MRDKAIDITKLGARLIGVSTDKKAAQAAFAAETRISFSLIPDQDRAIAIKYKVLMSGVPYARRTTFIVDATGTIRHVFEKVDVRNHGEEVLAVLKKLGAGPGGDTGHTGVLDEDSFKALHRLKEGEKPKLHGTMVDLAGGKAYLAMPKGKGPHPGVVVIHEWWGLNVHVKHWADRLAADGYAALAVDLYGGSVATKPDQAMALMKAVDERVADAVLEKALRYLRGSPKIRATKTATIGWCFGGAWSLRTALKNPDLDAAVIYYGRLKTEAATLKAIKAEVVGVFGNKDRGIPPKIVDAFERGLKEAGVKHAIHRYDANHAFANPSSARYDEKSASAAWIKVREFLARVLKASSD